MRGILLCCAPAGILLLAGGVLLSVGPSHSPAVRIDAPYFEPRSRMARISEALASRDFKRCEDLLRNHLRANPVDPDALLILAKVFKETDRLAESAEVLLRLVRSAKLDEAALRVAAGLLRELNTAHPQDLVPLKALAVALHKSGNHLGALAAAQRGLALDPGDRELLMLASEAAERSTLSAARPRSPDGLPQPLRYGRRSR
jgi:tetratricopeptide (TPR) repeat protein